MDPVIDNEWLTCKNDPIDDTQSQGNVARSWQWRELGTNPPHSPSNKTVFENIAEDILVQKPLKIRCCDLPGYPRSTFLMVFSPDGTKVASTHGNHNVYVSELASGKHVRILKGHPRTPWCIAFHPSHTQLIGSGCLGGQVRVWDISSGGSEVWNVHKETVIASIAFHPREQLLVIATYNELYFWDWSQPAPFTRVSTNNTNEKVRYVAFDALGYKLITGISLWANSGATGASVLQQNPTISVINNQSTRRDDNDDNNSGNRPQENNGTAQDMIVNSYQNLVQRYDSLVRNYQRLFMVRHRLATPPPPNTIDRGTDPMETDVSPSSSGLTRTARSSTSSAPFDDGSPGPSTSRRPEAPDSGDGENSSSRLLNLDVLSFNTIVPPRSQDSPQQEHSIFGSRSSAFQPLTERRTFRPLDLSDRSTRLLPNPFSSASTRSGRVNYSDSTQDSASTSRTSIFTSSRIEAMRRAVLERRRNSTGQNPTRTQNTSVSTDESAPGTLQTPSDYEATPSPQPATPTSAGTSTRPTMTNSSTQIGPMSGPVDAQTINESLDLIRDILRDSGTRLLNLITTMSLSNLVNVNSNLRGAARRSSARAQSDDSEGAGSARAARLRLLAPRPPRAPPRTAPRTPPRAARLLSSSSDSDSDQSLEVNIFRTRNSTFEDVETPDAPRPPAEERNVPTDRMTFELDDDAPSASTSRDSGRINVTLNDRFRVRTQNRSDTEEPDAGGDEDGPGPSTENADDPVPSTSGFTPRPSSSRDNFWAGGNAMSSDEAYRKVRGGVTALQKHTMQLTNLWLRGNRITMRELRNMWENLRRRILMLHRDTGRQDGSSVPSHYTRSLLERCMMLTNMNETSRTAPLRHSRTSGRSEAVERNTENNTESSASNDNSRNAGPSEPSAGSVGEPRASAGRASLGRPPSSARAAPSLRRRLQARWRADEDLRRRARNLVASRVGPKTNRSRRDFARAIEISAIRHEIRMRAMQVLSVMFNMMMMCLEERGLSQLIISMLRTLKRALALTCVMLMMNRNTGRQGNTSGSTGQRSIDPQIVHIQNIDHTGPVNVDEPDEPAAPRRAAAGPESTESTQTKTNEDKDTNTDDTLESPTTSMDSNVPEESPTSSASAETQRWSNRLAVQIAAANRNTSLTARTRRELYLESRRQKALHRTNPAAHPIVKKRAVPPVTSHRIPALRFAPSRLNSPKFSTPRVNQRSYEPVAGPSYANPPPDSFPSDSRDEMLNDFEHRVNLIRLAHLQAVRLRNAARTRFRRLQTIRLYTPSSVREMFALQLNNGENSPGSSPLQNGPELGNRRSFATYRPHILTPRSEASGRPSEEPGHFHTVLNNVAMPLMQVNDLPANNAEAQANQPSGRLPRIHEYLQPIILAQNAMVVDEDGGGEGGGGGGGGGGAGGGTRRISAGMAGLLDAGIISETLPTPSHRVQAWDFTTGDAPDIADSTKNIVVQRCRIHNDASIDISKDGRLLVALLPVPRFRHSNHWLGVYSLEWSRLGQCLHTAVLEQSAVSVALSPTARHLAVGLGSRRFTSAPHARNNVFALLYRLEPLESSSRTGLSPIKELEQNWEQGFTSLNCLRWAPQPGQGLVYANNTGQLIIMS